MDFITPREDMILMTPEWKGDRFDDGRPRVPDEILERLSHVKAEEGWAPLDKAGYKYQFEGHFRMINPKQIMVGRALTAIMVPARPDTSAALLEHGQAMHGYDGFFNQWTIACMQKGDILVVDMCDKVVEGTYVGGNLSTSIKTRNATKTGGAVIWGGIRDLQQVSEMPDFQIFYRGVDPTPIRDVMLSGINRPCCIGTAICMPGDVVLGTMSGVLFIPAHLAEESCIVGEKQQCKDLFGFERLADGTYTGAQIDTIWTKAIMEDFIDWFGKSPLAEPYQHLDWTQEIEESSSITEDGFRGVV